MRAPASFIIFIFALPPTITSGEAPPRPRGT